MSSSKKSDGSKPAAGIKVLRIGIVQNGKIIDERELKRRDTVSIGNSPKATFQVTSDALPRGVFDLFEAAGPKYWLRFTEGMDGRIQVGSKVSDFKSLEAEGRVSQRGDAKALELADDNRGKIVIGDVTVLFQFRELVAEPARPVLPPDARGSILQNIDAQFAGIFVLVAVLQISLVTYARSLPYIEPSSIEEVGERYQKLIMPDRIPEPPKDPVVDPGAGDKTKEKEPEKKDDPEKGQAKSKGNASKGKELTEEEAARARKAAITKQVAGKGLLKVLGSNSRSAGALSDVFQEGGVTGSLGDAFSGIQGVDVAESGGQATTRGGGAGEGVGIGELATEGGGSVKTGVKTEANVEGTLKTEAPEVDGKLSESEINSVMKRQLKSLRDCYESALKRTRTLAGKLVIRFEIDEGGRTQNVEFEDDSLGSGEVRECIAKRAKYWRFPKPDGGSVFVAYPIVFTPAQ